MNEKTIKLAIELHGHLAPGIALGIRMSEIALEKLSSSKGNKYLIGISETSRCLADAMQAATGCTLGHGSAFVKDYGKLAIIIGDVRTKKGVRVSLKENAYELSDIMKKWMMRFGKLSHEEEDILGKQLLEIDEKYLSIKDVEIDIPKKFDNSNIVKCSVCDEFVPEGLSIKKNDKIYCKACSYIVKF